MSEQRSLSESGLDPRDTQFFYEQAKTLALSGQGQEAVDLMYAIAKREADLRGKDSDSAQRLLGNAALWAAMGRAHLRHPHC